MKTILRLLLLCLLSTSYGQVAVQNMPPASTPIGSTDLTIADQGVSYPSCTTAGTGVTNACTRVATLAQIQAPAAVRAVVAQLVEQLIRNQ